MGRRRRSTSSRCSSRRSIKIASASLTDDNLLRTFARPASPSSLSTGMSTYAEIDHAVDVLGKEDLDPDAHHQHLPGQV
jgi:sialic acid synthase SpsE